MARYTGPVCRLCRREGIKLFLKGGRCDTAKCAATRREYPPGMHSWRRGKFSKYGTQLREKQKLKRAYGLREKQFRLYFAQAERTKGNTGENLLILLERRLDNVIYILGFAFSRAQCRQLICHGHIAVNGHRVDIPSYSVKPGEIIEPYASERSKKTIKQYLEQSAEREMPPWLERSTDPPKGTVAGMPTRDDITLPIQEQLVVEFSSK
ncbi:MAG: 30S ribosomal protein S4 [Planctomycetes bacterium]|jgi:small subunit ribosomal protein S4|nr:30S ribosomal protein S4 [Planctomycetota bacterium]